MPHLSVAACNLGHETVSDDNRIFCDNRHFDIAALTFGHDHSHFLRRNRRFEHRASFFGLAFDHRLTATGLRHSRQRGFPARIGGLIPRGAVAAIVDYQKND